MEKWIVTGYRNCIMRCIMYEPDQKFLRTETETFFISDFTRALTELKICPGDIVCVHSQIFSLGCPFISKENLLELLTEILQQMVVKNGTLIMPAFSYSFCKKELFDVQNTPSDVGVLTEFFRKQKNVKRTAHPIFSFSVWGEKQEECEMRSLCAFLPVKSNCLI